MHRVGLHTDGFPQELTMVKSLYNGDTKHKVLSEVTQMNLEDTVAFVEASVIGSAKTTETTGRTEDIIMQSI